MSAAEGLHRMPPTHQPSELPTVRVTALYRWKPGGRFDREQHRTKHMAWALDLLPNWPDRARIQSGHHAPRALRGTIVEAAYAYLPSLNKSNRR